MDDQTPEMEQLTQDMRAAMTAWVADPNNVSLRQQYRDLQRRYQRLFQELKRGQRNGVAGEALSGTRWQRPGRILHRNAAYWPSADPAPQTSGCCWR